jgi:hypothetical protein
LFYSFVCVRDLPTSKHPKEEREAHLTEPPYCDP